MMPVGLGIQMYATITSKDHVRHIQQDLQNMYFSDMYRDTILHCSDGSIYLSRLLTGLLFPFLKPSRCFQMLEEATLILPEYNKLEIEKSIFNLLGIKYSDQSQDAAFVAEWPKEIDKIIGTLHPTSPVKGYKNATKAVLHSAMTQETAVIHAASTDDERDDLRIVDGGDVETEEWRPAPSHQDDTRKIHKKLKVQHYNNVNNKSRLQPPPITTSAVAHHGPTPHPHASAVASLPPTAVTTTVEIRAGNHGSSSHGMPMEAVNMVAAHPQMNHQTQYLQTSEIVMAEGDQIVGDCNQIMMPSPGFLCTLCNTLYEDQKQFDAHIRQNHNLYKCKHCEATFKRQRDLLDHGRVHSGHKLIKCDICDKDFTERGLLWHTERFHKVEIPTPSTPVPTPAPSEEPKTKSNSLQDTLDSSKPMKKRGLKSDVTDPASSNSNTQDLTSPGKEKDSPTSSPQEQEKAKQRNKALKTTPTPDGKGTTEDPVYVKNNVYFSSSDSDLDDPSAGSVSERVKRKKTRSRHEEHCEKCGEAIPRRNIAEHRKACSGTTAAKKPPATPTNSNNTSNGGGDTPPVASSSIATRSGGGLSLTIPPPPTNDAPQIKLSIASPSGSAVTPVKGESGGSGKKTTLRKLFSCSYCHKKFSYNSSMRVHEKVHLGGKPYHCDMCDAKFSNKFDLYAHEKEHSDQRPHKCDMCQETFKTEENLRFHKMIHSAQEPITCKYCNKYFQTKQQLTEHEKVHTGPFKCTHCGISYDKATKLSSHIKSKHSKETAGAAK